VSELQDIATAYLTKAEALTNLHMILGHLPYARIEQLIKKGIFYNVSIDVKLLKTLLLARCDICLRAKITENAHKGKLKSLHNRGVVSPRIYLLALINLP